jgi:putative ABC transport system permease protein
MSIWSDVRARLRSLFGGAMEDRELDAELEYHMEREVEKRVLAGETPESARRQALLALGGLERTREEVRDARGVRPVEDFMRDVRHAVRALARRPAFTTVAVATLAIGIGATTAMFTIVNSVLLRALPYADPDRLVSVLELTPDGEPNMTSPANLTAWREQSATLSAIASWMDRPFGLTGDDPVEVAGRWVSDNYFSMLGVRALHGRTFVSGDEDETLAVLSHRFWRSRFGGDPDIVGRTIEIAYNPITVIGVLPPHLPMPPHVASDVGNPDVIRPFSGLPPDWRGRMITTAARLSPGATLEAAQAEMDVIVSRIAAEHPQYNRDHGVRVVPLQERMSGHARPVLLMLLGAVSLLLLIACANVASLFLGRAAARRREMTLRRALGAGQGRLVSHAMAEAFVVALAAGAVGVLLAHWATRAVAASLPSNVALPRLDAVGVDYRVLGFALAASLVVGLLFGAAPAFAGARTELGTALRESSRSATGSRSRLRSALVVGEVALALVLLAGAGLLYRTVNNLLDVDTGMRAEGVLTMRVTMPQLRYPDDDRRRLFAGELMEELRAVPGVSSVGIVGWLPLGGSKSRTSVLREDVPPPPEGEEAGADIRVVGGDYFEAMGMRLLRGRVFDETDTESAPLRFVINDALARQLFPGEDPIGRRLTYSWDDPWPSGEIIGVVTSVREMTLDAEASTALYLPHAHDPWAQVTAVIRTAVDPATLADAAVGAVHRIDPTLPVGNVAPYENVVAGTIARQRVSMMLLTGFAVVALVLVLIGIYGVIAYSVAQRVRELGVRMALGAQRRDVLRMVVGQGVALAALGIVAGTLAALALGRVLTGMLYGVAATDVPTLAAAASILALTAAAASGIPAWRAARIDPAKVLGNE